MADIIALIFVGVVALWIGFFVRTWRHRRAELRFRRDSLRFDEAPGLYHWTTLDGRTHTSETHPDQPGGIWYEAEREGAARIRS